jgi:Na+/H+-translocating membrane pyrophosphatase
MVALMTPTKEALRLTAENHPENAGAPAKSPPSGLAATIFLSCLCAIIGMVFGSAALSTAFMAETTYELLSVIPLILLAVCILGGWVGAFFWMVREDAAHPAS